MNRILHTNLYTPRAQQILNHGIWLLSGETADLQTSRIARVITVLQQPDGEVVLELNCAYWMYWNGCSEELEKMSDDEILSLLGKKLRSLAGSLISNDGRCAAISTERFHVYVQELDLIQDVLSGQEGWESRYPEDLREVLQGHERDQLATELAVLIEERRQEFNRVWRQQLNSAWAEGGSSAYEQQLQKRQRAREALDREFQNLWQKL